MGALGPVRVEQLTAKDSVEVVLDELNAGQCQMKSETSTDTKEKHAKLHYLLKSAKLIRRPSQKAKKRRVMGADATDDADMNVKQPAEWCQIRAVHNRGGARSIQAYGTTKQL